MLDSDHATRCPSGLRCAWRKRGGLYFRVTLIILLCIGFHERGVAAERTQHRHRLHIRLKERVAVRHHSPSSHSGRASSSSSFLNHIITSYVYIKVDPTHAYVVCSYYFNHVHSGGASSHFSSVLLRPSTVHIQVHGATGRIYASSYFNFVFPWNQLSKPDLGMQRRGCTTTLTPSLSVLRRNLRLKYPSADCITIK